MSKTTRARRRLLVAVTLLWVAVSTQGCQLLQNEFWAY